MTAREDTPLDTATEAPPTVGSRPVPGEEATGSGGRRRALRALRRALGVLLPGSPERVRGVPLASLAAGVLAAVAMALRLLVPTPVGVADADAGHDILCGLGLAAERPFDAQRATQFIVPQWTAQTWYGEACSPSPTVAPYSPHYALVALARILTPLVDPSAAFDTRAFALVGAGVFGVLVGLLVALLPGRLPFRLVAAAIVAVLVGDGVFADFLLSPYSEGTMLLGLLALGIAFLYLWRSPRPPVHAVLLAGVVCAVVVAIDVRLVPLAPAAVVALLWRSARSDTLGPSGRRSARDRPRRTRRGLPQAVAARVPAILVSLGLVAGTGVYVVDMEARADSAAVYDTVFRGILPASASPQADLAWFGLPARMVRASGAPIDSLAAETVFAGDAFDSVTPGRVLLFFATHPERLVSMSDRGLAAVGSPELDYLGSFPADSGATPWAKEHRDPVALGILTGLRALPLLIPGVQLLVLLLGLALAARRTRAAPARAVGRLAVLLVASCGLLFWAAVLGDPVELSRTLLPVGLLTALAIPLGVGCALLLAAPAPATPAPATTTPAAPTPADPRIADAAPDEGAPATARSPRAQAEKSAIRSPSPKNARTAATTRSLA